MLAVTLFVAGSMRETVSSSGYVSQTAPSPAAADSGGETLIRATTAFRAGSIRISVDSAVLMAQTAPSPTVRAPPPRGAGAPRPRRIRATTLPPRGSARVFAAAVWPLLATTARGAEVVADALTRASVLEAKLLTQTDPPAGATARLGAALAGGATRIGRPAAFPERTSIRLTV